VWGPLVRATPTKAASGLSALYFRVDGLKFVSSVVDFHSPVDATLGLVNVR
jgi:hypothetical protein